MEWLKTLLRNTAVSLGIIQKPAFVGQFLTEHPISENIHAGVVYIICSSGNQKWAMFRCPGHEDEIIQLCLMKKRGPRWTVKTDWLGRPTINPSVRQLEGSFAHFWIKTGHVEWCVDSSWPPTNFTRNYGRNRLGK